jgi:lysocardiolipin and lysophospholipid acyltransferase
MFKQVTFTVFLTVWYVYVSYIFVLPSILLNKEKSVTDYLKIHFQNAIHFGLKYAFEADLYYKNEIKYIPNKINIITCNHLCTIDWEFIIGLLNELHINKYIIVGKIQLVYFPGFGFSYLFGNNIKLERNWELDKDSIDRQLNSIDEGILFIFPEGTRFSIDKHKDAVLFSQNNNLPVYNNLLVPKSKGLWTICNKLKNINKLGAINDITIIMDNFRKQNAYSSDLIKKPIGKIFMFNRQIFLPHDITDNTVFKNWLLHIWTEKDIIIDNYKNIDFVPFNFHFNVL